MAEQPFHISTTAADEGEEDATGFGSDSFEIDSELESFLKENDLISHKDEFVSGSHDGAHSGLGAWTLDMIWDCVAGDGDEKEFFDCVPLHEDEKRRLIEGLALYAPEESDDDLPALEEESLTPTTSPKPSYCVCGNVVQGKNSDDLWECLHCYATYSDKTALRTTKPPLSVYDRKQQLLEEDEVTTESAPTASEATESEPTESEKQDEPPALTDSDTFTITIEGTKSEEESGSSESVGRVNDAVNRGHASGKDEAKGEDSVGDLLDVSSGGNRKDPSKLSTVTLAENDAFFQQPTRDSSASLMSMQGWTEMDDPSTFLDTKQSLLNMSFAMQEHLLRMHDQLFNLTPDLQGRAPGAPSARELLDEYKEKQRNLQRELEQQKLELETTSKRHDLLEKELQSEKEVRLRFEASSSEHRKQLQERYQEEIKKLEDELSGKVPKDLITLEEQANELAEKGEKMKDQEKILRDREMSLAAKTEDFEHRMENETIELETLRKELESREEALRKKEDILSKEEKELSKRVHEQKKGSAKIENQNIMMQKINQDNIKRGAKISKWLDRLNQRVYEKCAFCSENVMPGSERLNLHKKIVHWNCFRCQNPGCKIKLKPTSYRVMKKIYFCDSCAKDGRIVRRTLDNPAVKVLGDPAEKITA